MFKGTYKSKKVVIKFCECYGTDAHSKLASLSLAPDILANCKVGRFFCCRVASTREEVEVLHERAHKKRPEPARPERWESREHGRNAYYSKDQLSDSESEVVGCLATHAYLTSECKAQRWIVDLGATSHISCDRKLFKTFRETSNEMVVTIRSLKVTGTGNVVLWMNSGPGGRQVELTLHDVLFVPGLARNLFSVSKAAKMGKMLHFTEQECLVKEVRSNCVVASGHREGGSVLPMFAQCPTQCTPGIGRAVASKVRC